MQLRRYLKLYRAIFLNNLERELEFRLDFIVGNLTTLIWFVANILMIKILYLHTDTVAGWTSNELLVLLGIFLLVRNIFGFFFENNLDNLSDYIRLGTLDFFMVKPVNLQFLFSNRYLNFSAVSQLLLAPILILYAAKSGSMNLSFADLLVFPLLIFSGVSAVYSLWLILVSLAFYFVGTENYSLLFEIILDTTRYPLDIYRGFLKDFLTFIFPLILIATLPTRLLVRVLDFRLLTLELIGAFVLLVLSHQFFLFSLKRYSSASS